MHTQKLTFDIHQLLRIALFLWMGYFAVLTLVDWGFTGSRSLRILIYYTIQGLNGLLIIGGVLLVPKEHPWSKKIVFLALLLMTTVPMITVHIMVRTLPNEILRSPDATNLRLMPIRLMGVLLMAWEYRWRHVALLCVAMAVINLSGIFLLPPFPPPHLQTLPQTVSVPRVRPEFLPPPTGGILMTIIQTISFLPVGYITSILIEHLRSQQQSLEKANAQLRHQANTREELTISRERNRMARELHDTLAHTLSGLTVQLQTVKAYWEIEPTASQEMLDDALAATRSGLQETRRALKSLRASPLEDLGLSLALQQLAKSAAEQANLALRLSIIEPLPQLAPEVSQCVYRVAQEAIMNVVHHADAKHLYLHVEVNGHSTELTVADDGISFDVNQEYPGHWGVAGMIERAALVGGQLTINSQTDRGTTVQLRVPESAL